MHHISNEEGEAVSSAKLNKLALIFKTTYKLQMPN